MDELMAMFSRGLGQLLDRSSGPMNFRFVVMPTVVSLLAIRAGLRDAREGRPAFLWALFAHPSERGRLFHSTRRDIGRVLIVALVLDTTYQILVFRLVYVIQALVVAVGCAVVPYALVRGPVTRLARWLRKPRVVPKPAAESGLKDDAWSGGEPRPKE